MHGPFSIVNIQELGFSVQTTPRKQPTNPDVCFLRHAMLPFCCALEPPDRSVVPLTSGQ